MAKILFIDDDQTVRDVCCAILASDGHVVLSGLNGTDGIRLAGDQKFDVVITDILMPEKEGIEFILDLRKQKKSIPVIAISGAGADLLSAAKRFGASFTLEKPFSRSELLAVVNKALDSVQKSESSKAAFR
ncbi:MAG: response regulator [Planctomycetes bacterium]|nr:response regulator [Planctomycetota bacterium]